MRKKRGVSSYGEDDSYSLEKIHSSKGFFTFTESVHPAYVLIVLIVVLLLAIFAAYLALMSSEEGAVPTCGDGTFYNTCSLDKPHYCDSESGKLIEKASICGCTNGVSFENASLIKQNDSCVFSMATNPKDITLSYFFKGQKKEMNFTVYEGIAEHVAEISRPIFYFGSEVPSRADFVLKSISDEVQRFELLKLVKKIQNAAPNSKEDQARIAISIVQNIPYGDSNKTIRLVDKEVDYSRYPYEVLYDFKGICGEKSSLLIALLKELDYGTSMFYFPEENHEAVGIKCPIEKSLYSSGFCFVETGGPAIISDDSMEFINGETLDSVPQVMLTSTGISLPEDMDEYDDADTMENIRKKNFLGYLNFWKYDNLIEKYNLEERYSLS